MRYLRRQRHTLYRHVSRLPLHKPVGLWRFSRRTQVAIVILVVLGTSIPATLFRPFFAHANSIGPNGGTTAATTVNGTSTNWTNPNNALASDSTYATVALAAGATSYNLNITGFGFAIPTGSTINGVTVDVEKYAPTVSKSTVEDKNVQLLKAGVAGGTSLGTTTAWPTSNSYVTYGGATNLWGNTLAPSDVNASNFGVTLSVTNIKSGGGASNTAYVDYVRVTIAYTPPPTTYNQASYRLFQNQDASGAEVGGFQSDGTVSPGTNPFGAAIADFNGDGHMDIATANSGAASVGILSGNGTGGFSLASSPAVGTAPYNIVTADFNGDGHPDLAVTNYSSGTVSILLNNGSGGFSVSSTVTVGASPYGLVAADFNGDGKPDLAVANSGANTVSILLNNGSGGFTVSSSPAVGTTPYGITAADFDGDGHIDLAVVNDGGSTVSILHNTGTGTFTLASSPAVGSSPYYIVTADFNGDGHPDLAVTNYSSGTVSILLNNGSGGFNVSTGPSIGSAMGIVTADFNGDGHPDLAVTSNLTSGTVSILLNNGSGSFTTSSSVNAGNSTRNIAAGDFNGDGKPDLVALNNIDSTGSIFLNAFAAPVGVGASLTTSQNMAATAPGDGQPFRLRMDIGVATAALAANGQTFKLQYAPMTTSCDVSFTNTPNSAYSDVTDTTTVKYYKNTVASNGASLTTNANDPTDGTNGTAPYGNGNVIPETYQQQGTATFTNPTAIPAGDDGMWDFALTTNQGLGGQSYCLRIVAYNGGTETNLNTYTAIAQINMPATTYNQATYRFFQNKDAASGGGKWAAFTTTNAEVAYNSAPVASDTTKVGFQVGVAGTTKAGTYNTTVIYTATPVY